MTSSSDPPAVLHYVQSWLEPSEQFVEGLITRSRYPRLVVVGRDVTDLARFPISPLRRLGWVGRLPGEAVRRRLRTAILLGLAARHGVGLVHAHFGYRLPEVTGLVARRGLPLVASLHGHDVLGWDELPPTHYRDMVPHLSRVIVPSAWLAGVVEEHGVPAERISVIPSGVDTAWFRPSPVPDAPVAVFVGRFVEKKGLDVLAAAWPIVRSAVTGAELRLCGYGPLRDLVAGLPGVTIVDRPDRARVRDEIAAARVLVSPSRTATDGDAETLLIANLEAQASGRPVVSTQHGGIPEYVHDGETGLLVPEGEVTALADALVAVLRDDGLARRLGSAGPAYVARWDVHRCAAEVDLVYDALVGG